MCRPSKIDGRCVDLRRPMIDVKLICCYIHLLKTLMVYLYANNCAEGLHFSAFIYILILFIGFYIYNYYNNTVIHVQ